MDRGTLDHAGPAAKPSPDEPVPGAAPPGLLAFLDQHALPLGPTDLAALPPGPAAGAAVVVALPVGDERWADLGGRLAARGIAVLPHRPGETAAEAWWLGPVPLAAWVEAAGEDRPAEALVRLDGRAEATLYRFAAARAGIAALAPGDRLTPVPLQEPEILPRLRAAGVETVDGRRLRLVAPRLHRLTEVAARAAAAAGPVALATPRGFEALLRAAIAERTLRAALARLPGAGPELSAGDPALRTARLAVALAPLGLAGLWTMFPAAVGGAVLAASAIVFLALGALRVAAALRLAPVAVPPPVPTDGLPGYSVLVALYDEAHMVPGLVAALDRLDYPADKLEVMLLLEADDAATAAAVDAAVATRLHMRRVTVPRGRPRTKPRALAYGLAFAQGDLVTIYDAEDRPDPGQLRAAAAAFAAGPDHLACVQARLVIDGCRTRLQRQFAVEYALLFDGLLPWMAARALPLPLGGTSNHFKRAALLAVGGWDPHNVTEDADLGLRLARFGFTSAMLASATREHAPAASGVWMRQRTRWMKGWIVTAVVHGRDPRRLLREVGGRPSLAFAAQVAGTVLAALAHPVGLALIALHAAGLLSAPGGVGFLGDLVAAATALAYGFGYGGSMLLARRALRAGGRDALLPAVWFMPAYWLMGSVAAWRALAEVAVLPDRWAKTPHDAHDEADRAPTAGETAAARLKAERMERVKGIEPSS